MPVQGWGLSITYHQSSFELSVPSMIKPIMPNNCEVKDRNGRTGRIPARKVTGSVATDGITEKVS